MLYEYAVEPRAIGSSWQTFRYVIEKFGFDRGRLISEFPDTWFRLVYDGTDAFPPVERKKVVEALNLAKRNKVVKSARPYDPGAGDWLYNALAQNTVTPFHAIIALENPGNHDRVLPVGDLDENQPLMAVPQDWVVNRDAPSLAAAMKLMLQSANVVVLVDPYYDPFSPRYQNTLRECLRIVQNSNPRATCAIHHLDHDRSPSVGAIERDARAKFGTVIPEGMTITLYRWREKDGGADFHARYLLTDRGGMRIDAGFSEEGGHQTTDIALMNFELSQQKRNSLDRDADVFELVKPVLQIGRNGYVRHV
jgi:hypothetical protein